jgi:voltage-gated potassium channel Kch
MKRNKTPLGLTHQITLLLIFVAILAGSIIWFIIGSNHTQFHVRDVAELVVMIVDIFFYLFVQLPQYKHRSLMVYRAGYLLISPSLIILFAKLDWLLSKINPHGFNVVLSKWDALYFTVTTLATVGYGDIRPVSTGARILITLQIIFGFIFVVFILQREITASSKKRR